MKTLLYIIISSVICLTLHSGIVKSNQKLKNVILTPALANVKPDEILKSSDIISARLKYYGVISFDVLPEGKGQIKVSLPDDIDLSEIEGLLTLKGELAFYETLDRNNFADLLKSNNAGSPLLVRSDVESIASSFDEVSNTVLTKIEFKPSAINIWADATRRNMNKHIAIVIDNQIFYSPVVKSVIEDGLCEISGTLTQKETRNFIALVNNGPLPVGFTLGK